MITTRTTKFCDTSHILIVFAGVVGCSAPYFHDIPPMQAYERLNEVDVANGTALELADLQHSAAVHIPHDVENDAHAPSSSADAPVDDRFEITLLFIDAPSIQVLPCIRLLKSVQSRHFIVLFEFQTRQSWFTRHAHRN